MKGEKMAKKWIDIQVSKELYSKMCEGKETCPVQVNSTPKKEQTPKKYVPYLEVIMTGKKSEKRFENFKKVRFPALCIYGWNKEYLGVINCAYIDEEITYELHDITEQHNRINRQSGFVSLEEMHEHYNIQEIVKAKIIVKRG